MPLVVDATVGGASSNSYQTVESITTYFLARVPSSIADEWTDLSSEEQAAAAVMSTMWMDSLIHWSHFPTTSTQALLWPQYGQLDRRGWTMVPLDIIPQELKNCHAELALYLSQEDRVSEDDAIALGISEIKTGSTKIRFRENIPVMNQPSLIPKRIINLLVPSWIHYVEDESVGFRTLERA